LRSIEDSRIGIIGLGYVGLPLAVEFGKHFPTVGFDIKKDRIAELERGNDSTLETTTEELRAAQQLKFSTDRKTLAECNTFIVTVPTPVGKNNRPVLTPLKGASETVGSVLKKGDVVVYESTVYPGCTEEYCVPILEQHSGLKFNKDLFCGYSPERINPVTSSIGCRRSRRSRRARRPRSRTMSTRSIAASLRLARTRHRA